MSIIPKFSLIKKSGSPIGFGSEEMWNYCKSLPDGEYTITIEPANGKKSRSNNQNRYYWGVLMVLLSEYCGYTIDECHEICRHLFLNTEHLIQLKKGHKEIAFPRSTTSLTTAEMESYLSQIREWMSLELGVYAPLPNEVTNGY